MRESIRGAVVAIAAACVIVAAPAQANCWKADAVAAAKVRDMETMLMVSALRCRASGDLLARYNAFVVQSRGPLTEVNDTLRGHFAESVGKSGALDAYDNFVTAIANRYGAGAAGLSCADMDAIADAALAEGTSFAALADLAQRAGVVPVLNEAACDVQVAVLTQ